MFWQIYSKHLLMFDNLEILEKHDLVDSPDNLEILEKYDHHLQSPVNEKHDHCLLQFRVNEKLDHCLLQFQVNVKHDHCLQFQANE